MAQLAGAALLAALVAFTAVACGGSDSTQSVVAPTGTLVTDSFSGTVAAGGSGPVHPFTVTVGGTVSVTLLTAGPPPTISMGLAIGTPSGSTCALLSGGSTVTPAGSTAQLNGTLAAGSYCVVVVDVGNAAGPITYTLAVAHT